MIQQPRYFLDMQRKHISVLKKYNTVIVVAVQLKVVLVVST